MRIIKVDATDSTNSFLREFYRENSVLENTCVIANEQRQGRGQMGAGWQSEPGKNLTFSVLFTTMDLPVNRQFALSALMGLALLEALEKLDIGNFALKWPNDILAGNKKIAGILIENFLKADKIHASIVGVGLNVNQEKFDALPQASSLKQATGKEYALNPLLESIIHFMENRLRDLNLLSTEDILAEYHRNLFGYEKPHRFQLPNGECFQGTIKGVSAQGKLQILHENKKMYYFEVKEIKMLY